MDLKGKYICVFGASSPKTKEAYKHAAYELGRLIGENAIGSVSGAGRAGLMASVIEGTLAGGGKAVGVIPQFMVDNNWHHPNLSKTIVTDDMHQRKQTMASRCDAVIALPGGVGTFEELLEVITWKQLGIFHKPIVILNIDGYYDSLLSLFHKAIEEDFMNKSNLQLWKVVSTPQEAINFLLETPSYYQSSEEKY